MVSHPYDTSDALAARRKPVALTDGGTFVSTSHATQRVQPGGVFDDSTSEACSIARQIGG